MGLREERRREHFMEILMQTERGTLTYNADDREYVFTLTNIKQGYYVCVNLCTQARFAGRFWLDEAAQKGNPSAGRKTLIAGEKKDSTVDFHVINANPTAAYYDTEDLRLHLVVDIPKPDVRLHCFDQFVAVRDTVHAKDVGDTYLLCFEDWTDYDYNDFVFTISAWKKKG